MEASQLRRSVTVIALLAAGCSAPQVGGSGDAGRPTDGGTAPDASIGADAGNAPDAGNTATVDSGSPADSGSDMGLDGGAQGTGSCVGIFDCLEMSGFSVAEITVCDKTGTPAAQAAFNPVLNCSIGCASVTDADACFDSVIADGGLCVTQWQTCEAESPTDAGPRADAGRIDAGKVPDAGARVDAGPSDAGASQDSGPEGTGTASCVGIFDCLEMSMLSVAAITVCDKTGTPAAQTAFNAVLDCSIGCASATNPEQCINSDIADGGPCLNEWNACVAESAADAGARVDGGPSDAGSRPDAGQPGDAGSGGGACTGDCCCAVATDACMMAGPGEQSCELGGRSPVCESTTDNCNALTLCPQGYSCSGHTCVCSDPTVCGVVCSPTGACPCGLICGAANTCVPCAFDQNCPSGQVCSFQLGCIAPSIAGNGPIASNCEEDSQCQSTVCVDDTCVQGCQSNSDCPSGEECWNYDQNTPDNIGCVLAQVTNCGASCNGPTERCSSNMTAAGNCATWCTQESDCAPGRCLASTQDANPGGAAPLFYRVCETGSPVCESTEFELDDRSSVYCSAGSSCGSARDCTSAYDVCVTSIGQDIGVCARGPL